MKYSVKNIELDRVLTRDDFVFFWGHVARADKQMKACLSQWWQCSFEVDGIYYNCAEQYMMAEKARQLVAEHRPDHLIIEGGATAWATLQALGWTDFAITAQLAPGVVQMSATNGTLVTLKPGSYPWGDIKQSRSYLPV